MRVEHIHQGQWRQSAELHERGGIKVQQRPKLAIVGQS